MEGRRIRTNKETATTLALTGGYLLMEGDFRPERKGRRINAFVDSSPFSLSEESEECSTVRGIMDTQMDT